MLNTPITVTNASAVHHLKVCAVITVRWSKSFRSALEFSKLETLHGTIAALTAYPRGMNDACDDYLIVATPRRTIDISQIHYLDHSALRCPFRSLERPPITSSYDLCLAGKSTTNEPLSILVLLNLLHGYQTL